jgi:hypothetical protein
VESCDALNLHQEAAAEAVLFLDQSLTASAKCLSVKIVFVLLSQLFLISQNFVAKGKFNFDVVEKSSVQFQRLKKEFKMGYNEFWIKVSCL